MATGLSSSRQDDWPGEAGRIRLSMVGVVASWSKDASGQGLASPNWRAGQPQYQPMRGGSWRSPANQRNRCSIPTTGCLAVKRSSDGDQRCRSLRGTGAVLEPAKHEESLRRRRRICSQMNRSAVARPSDRMTVPVLSSLDPAFRFAECTNVGDRHRKMPMTDVIG